jgi:hypothetical protein
MLSIALQLLVLPYMVSVHHSSMSTATMPTTREHGTVQNPAVSSPWVVDKVLQWPFQQAGGLSDDVVVQLHVACCHK